MDRDQQEENTYPSLYVADNSSWMAPSGLDGFCLSVHVFVFEGLAPGIDRIDKCKWLKGVKHNDTYM